MKNITRTGKYLKARTLVNQWALCSKARKAYAKHLVTDYGWPVKMAVQHAYIFGYDKWTFDYRSNCAVVDSRSASSFGF